MKTLLKPCIHFSNTNAFTNVSYEKPSVCPHCGVGTDAPLTEKAFWGHYDDSMLFIAECQCTSCRQIFFFACHQKKESYLAKLVCIHPSSETTYKNEILEKISPRFIDMYNQAIRAEKRDDTELAATGYRSSLEVLIKDYAINELNAPRDEVIACTLNNAISKYLNQDELVNSADVIRILGNDFTHYERKYPQHDFDILKDYMDIFITLIIATYKVKHPPVGRNVPK